MGLGESYEPLLSVCRQCAYSIDQHGQLLITVPYTATCLEHEEAGLTLQLLTASGETTLSCPPVFDIPGMPDTDSDKDDVPPGFPPYPMFPPYYPMSLYPLYYPTVPPPTPRPVYPRLYLCTDEGEWSSVLDLHICPVKQDEILEDQAIICIASVQKETDGGWCIRPSEARRRFSA
ncbi:uncharacterized protein LOC108933835 [Arapaima gigas]